MKRKKWALLTRNIILIICLVFICYPISAQEKEADETKSKTKPAAVVKKPSKMKMSVHAGFTMPSDYLHGLYNSSYDLMFGLEHELSSGFSIRVFSGYNHFKARVEPTKDTNIVNININIKYAINLGQIDVFAEAGPGYYVRNNRPNAFGLNFGSGIWYGLSKNFGLELAAHYHSVFTSTKINFMSITAGFTINF